LEQNVLKHYLLRVLMITRYKNCQLDMLIFVQVFRTIGKNLRSLLGYGRTKESKGINEKQA